MNNIQRDFARKRGLRMADGGEAVPLSSISLRDQQPAPAQMPDALAKTYGFPMTAPIDPAAMRSAPIVLPHLNTTLVPNPTPSTQLYTDELGVRGATGGGTQDLVKVAKKRLGLRGYAAGGPIHGPGGPTDDKVPAMLSDGEYVLPAKTVAALGKDNLDHIVTQTNGKLPAGAHGLRTHFATGGLETGNPIYVTPEGFASTDPNVGQYNKAAMSASAAAPADAAASTAEAGPGMISRGLSAATDAVSKVPYVGRPIAAGLRGAAAVGSSVGPAIAKVSSGLWAAEGARETAADSGKDLSDMDESSIVPSSVTNSLTSPTAIASLRGAPIVGPALGGLADSLDPETTADTLYRGLRAVQHVVPFGNTAGNFAGSLRTPATPQNSAATALKDSTPAPAPQPLPPGVTQRPDGTLVGSYGGTEGGGAGGLRSQPVVAPHDEELRAAIDAATNTNPFQGVRGNFYTGGDQKLASNIADTLNARSRAKMLLSKYGTDTQAEVARENNARTHALTAARLHYDMANTSQEQLRSATDRIAEVPTLDKDGNVSGKTIDPTMRNHLEAYTRNATAGFDQMSPEQQAAAMEGNVHKLMIRKLADSGDFGTMGKFLTNTGVGQMFGMNALGTPSDAQWNVKSIAPLNASDFLQNGVGMTDILGGRPYAEFDNGKKYPLAALLQNPSYKSAFESGVARAPKSVQAQYLKHAPNVRVAGAN